MTNTVPNQGLETQSTGVDNSPIDRQTEHNIHVYCGQSKEAISKRIQELKSEWSLDRIIEAGVSILALIGIILGAFVSKFFLILAALGGCFFLAHAILRFRSASTNKGTRAQCDIDAEKFAMKILSGDCASNTADADKAALAEKTIAATRTFCSPA